MFYDNMSTVKDHLTSWIAQRLFLYLFIRGNKCYKFTWELRDLVKMRYLILKLVKRKLVKVVHLDDPHS